MTQPTLDRTLRLKSIVLFGLAYMAPMIVLGTFGAIAKETNGTVRPDHSLGWWCS